MLICLIQQYVHVEVDIHVHFNSSHINMSSDTLPVFVLIPNTCSWLNQTSYNKLYDTGHERELIDCITPTMKVV